VARPPPVAPEMADRPDVRRIEYPSALIRGLQRLASKKLSPVLWSLFLLVVLFIPMQWGAPTGDVLVVQRTIQIIPNVLEQTTVRAPSRGIVTNVEALRPGARVVVFPVQQAMAFIDGDDAVARRLPLGAVGTAAIYTGVGAPTYIIRRVMMRMEA